MEYFFCVYLADICQSSVHCVYCVASCCR